MQADISFSPSFYEVMQSTTTQKVETSALGKGGRELRSMCFFEESENGDRFFHLNSHYASQSMSRSSKSARLDSTISAAQRMRTMNKAPLVHDKENMQTDISFSPSVDQGSGTAGKVRKVRGSNNSKKLQHLKLERS